MASIKWTPSRLLTSVDEAPLVNMDDGSSDHPIYGNIDPTSTTRHDDFALDDSNIYANAPPIGHLSQNDEQSLYANITG